MHFQHFINPRFRRNFLVKIWSYQKQFALFPGVLLSILNFAGGGLLQALNFSLIRSALDNWPHSWQHQAMSWWPLCWNGLLWSDSIFIRGLLFLIINLYTERYNMELNGKNYQKYFFITTIFPKLYPMKSPAWIFPRMIIYPHQQLICLCL